MTRSSSTASIVSVRVSAEERALLEGAAHDAGATLSDFVRRKSVEAAEMETLARNRIVIPAEHWEAFEAWLGRPSRSNAGLGELMRSRPVWEA